MSGKRKSHSVLLFFVSMFLTVFILGSGMLFILTDRIPASAGTTNKDELSAVRMLFCETDNNISYEINIDISNEKLSVKRLNFDNSVYHSSGLSGTVLAAETAFGKFSGAIMATETQAAALIDYSGGFPCDVGEHISKLCGGIGTGYQVLAGITIIEIFKHESNNRELCLQIIETAALNWCKMLGEPRHFFKLLDLSTNNLSYTGYLPLSEHFTSING